METMTKLFGERLRELRVNADFGLRELARRIDKSPGYLSDVENGRVPPPSESLIIKIAQALQANQNELLILARKVDPELSDYVAGQPEAADFLRMAKEQNFQTNDWEKLSKMVTNAGLGKTKRVKE